MEPDDSVLVDDSDFKKESDQHLSLQGSLNPPVLLLGNVDSTDSDSDESSEDHSPRFSHTGKWLIFFLSFNIFSFRACLHPNGKNAFVNARLIQAICN